MKALESGGRVATDPRISRRRLAVARVRRRRLVTRVAGAAAAGALLWVAFASPLLTVREVQVVGARHTGPAEVANAAGLSGDENLLLLSTAAVARAAKTLPWVARAAVDRKLPGTIRVAIEERSPAAVVAGGEGRWLIDARGHVLAPAPESGLPVIADEGLDSLRPGARVTAAEVVAGLRVLRALPEGLGARVEAVFAPSQERVTLSLDGALVRFGAAEQLDAKVVVLKALLERMHKEGIAAAYVDVRVPSSPALGPSAPVPPARRGA